MAQQALYRAWRPQTFDDVVGQKAIVAALRQALQSQQLAHAYLFCGTRGTGKTSLAKILARAAICLNPQPEGPCNQCEMCKAQLSGQLFDVAEIDAASNNSVDNVRKIIEELAYLPSQARYKIYIIDEAHMLSSGAFNALLKTLEEPPAHVIFILATTDPQRLPSTILSRCQRYDFHRISEADIQARLTQVAQAENLPFGEAALRRIAILADGALRDALSLLDQAAVMFPDGADESDILHMTGRLSRLRLARLVTALSGSEPLALLEQLHQLLAAGQDVLQLTQDLAAYLRDLLLARAALLERPQERLDVPLSEQELHGLLLPSAEDLRLLDEQAHLYAQPELVHMIQALYGLLPQLKQSSQARTVLEICLLSLMGRRQQPLETQLAAKEAQSALGTAQVTPTASSASSAVASANSKPPAAPSAPVSEVSPPVASSASASEPVEVEMPTEKASMPLTQDESQAHAASVRESAVAPESKQPVPPEAVPHNHEAQASSDQVQEKQADASPANEQPNETERESLLKAQPRTQAEPQSRAQAEIHTAARSDNSDSEELSPALPPQTAPSADPVATSAPAVAEATPTAAPDNLAEQWQKVLQSLQQSDMFLCLFVRSAILDWQDGHLLLHFPEAFAHNANVLDDPTHHKNLQKSLIAHGLPGDFLVTRDGACSSTNSWLENLSDAAEELGIPVTRVP